MINRRSQQTRGPMRVGDTVGGHEINFDVVRIRDCRYRSTIQIRRSRSAPVISSLGSAATASFTGIVRVSFNPFARARASRPISSRRRSRLDAHRYAHELVCAGE